jgi:hypothetical protein
MVMLIWSTGSSSWVRAGTAAALVAAREAVPFPAIRCQAPPSGQARIPGGPGGTDVFPQAERNWPAEPAPLCLQGKRSCKPGDERSESQVAGQHAAGQAHRGGNGWPPSRAIGSRARPGRPRTWRHSLPERAQRTSMVQRTSIGPAHGTWDARKTWPDALSPDNRLMPTAGRPVSALTGRSVGGCRGRGAAVSG